MIKFLMKLEIESSYFTILKATYDRLWPTLHQNREKLKAFLLKSEMRQECPLLPL
jgi:hypothetical protein